ncbi:hypothetical protein BF49_6224 [Bradyrhizobium sp.]|nr:hypothetical protein BF49_6224 [Bradyrhizobium sp.]
MAAGIVHIEIDRADFQLTRNVEWSGDALEPWQRGVQRLGGRAAQLKQPGIVEAAVDEQIGAHPRPDRKKRQVGDAVARPFREIGQRREVERVPSRGHHVEPDRNRMAGTDDLSRDSQLMAQADIEAVGEHDQPGGDHLVVGESDLLPLRTCLDQDGLGADALDAGRNFVADSVDEGIVEDVELPARRLVEKAAEARDPVLTHKGRAAQHRFGDSRLQESPDLHVTTEFFDSKVRRIALMRIDQDGRNAATAEHRGGGRAGQSPADNGNVGVPHGANLCPRRHIDAATGKKALANGYKSIFNPGINRIRGGGTHSSLPPREGTATGPGSEFDRRGKRF